MDEMSRDTRDWYERFYVDRGLLSAGPWYVAAAELLFRFEPCTDQRLVVEVGCGAGAFLERVEGHRLGLDPSLEACRLTGRRGSPSVVAEGEELPLRDESATVVVLREVIEHVRSPRTVLAEASRVLVDGGLLLVSCPNYLHVPWLIVRLLGQVLGRRNWTELQPCDRIMTALRLGGLLRRGGFQRVAAIGTVLDPPLVYHWSVRRGAQPLASRRFWYLGLHPVIAARKRSGGQPGPRMATEASG